MADITEAIRRLIFEYTSEGADKVMQTQEAVAASTTKTDKASLSLEKSFGNLERRYVDTVRHQQDYQKVQERVNAAVAQNPALQDRANAVLAAASEHYDKLALNANKGGIATSFLSKAISTIIGPAGLIGVALTAATAAVVYLVEKFQLIPGVLNLIAAALASIGLERAAQSVGQYEQRMRAVNAAAQEQKAALEAIQAAHPKISIEVAKQVQLQEAQLQVAQARTPEEKQIADLNLKQVEYKQQGLNADEQALLLARDKAKAEANLTKEIERQAQANFEANERKIEQMNEQAGREREIGNEIQRNVGLTREWGQAMGTVITWTKSLVEGDLYDNVFGGTRGNRYDMELDPLGQAQQFEALKRVYGAENVELVTQAAGTMDAVSIAQLTEEYLWSHSERIMESQHQLTGSTDALTDSTDSLNATMQEALSPFYSQDPRTTKLGFRAGTVGNPDWMTGATNANPLVAVLGAGATAPGMANGGSFTVGGGYSANDNRMAVFPVASGEEVVINRNREGRGGQVVNIDNRIIITGSVDGDALSKMKVSRYQQAQRMRAGMARG